ncbi:interferon-stimulated gene 20 kDa protein isoform X1 [Mus musculus]|uniref:Interferon-stimulated gene 20 kDa protein n=1 Tax=Mus musculus TaxID=10090 RepID=ISG20_MOUSE|nr:interferon-stimulated gene 20 kDa protein isoform a [Mus musculus]XP_006541089.1 interferon-stimulated gene 20 kDa protein isoform X1 [Mus musculus]XP_006541091.1 interferon-stimulated gene 20 kDa protein isoform X1 [Mus musculus]XP_030098687.1 interferon-stimulated gene 20 kDa protein isoform X1 [Mus musculus]Q9JL16.1 RecName: Full=Interferon-stimulated gene 20 kDa protein; AltName: Full=Promyelocytic leukemia nuclear body-associated protein ISG20; AltName: Full=Protein DnaQL [Mus musculus]|eukprot:NP_001278149.1 interferon-stimulated gene 20 kDa protein isoform a [Mus musculus]
MAGIPEVVAMDCEMVGLGPQRVSGLARCSIVNIHGAVLYDKYIRPEGEITDYRTQVSGVTPQHMVRATPFGEARLEILQLLKGKLVVGHDLKHDFNALKEDMSKYTIYDTSTDRLLWHEAKLQYYSRVSLRLLCKRLLHKNIQVLPGSLLGVGGCILPGTDILHLLLYVGMVRIADLRLLTPFLPPSCLACPLLPESLASARSHAVISALSSSSHLLTPLPNPSQGPQGHVDRLSGQLQDWGGSPLAPALPVSAEQLAGPLLCGRCQGHNGALQNLSATQSPARAALPWDVRLNFILIQG